MRYWKETIIIDTSKIVVVTGAASGIGRATAEKYKLMGHEVIGIDKEIISCDFRLLACDLADENQVKSIFASLSEEYQEIDYLINVAGVYYVKKRNTVTEMELSVWNATLQNNLTAAMLCCKYVVPFMENKKAEDRAIVNITSDQAFYPRRKNSAYAVSKSGISCLTKVLAQELIDSKIRVNAIAPASVRTNFIQGLATSKRSVEDIYLKEDQKMPLGLIMPEDVAELAFFLGSKLAKRVTGQIIMMDSGLYERGE